FVVILNFLTCSPLLPYSSRFRSECEPNVGQLPSCASYGHEQGAVTCNDECKYDPSGCHTCGDGILNPVKEECDSALPVNTICSQDRKSTRLNSSHVKISYAVFCL